MYSAIWKEMHTALLPVNPIEILIYTSCDFTFFPNTHMSATLLSVSSKGPSTKSPTSRFMTISSRLRAVISKSKRAC